MLSRVDIKKHVLRKFDFRYRIQNTEVQSDKRYFLTGNSDKTYEKKN